MNSHSGQKRRRCTEPDSDVKLTTPRDGPITLNQHLADLQKQCKDLLAEVAITQQGIRTWRGNLMADAFIANTPASDFRRGYARSIALLFYQSFEVMQCPCHASPLRCFDWSCDAIPGFIGANGGHVSIDYLNNVSHQSDDLSLMSDEAYDIIKMLLEFSYEHRDEEYSIIETGVNATLNQLLSIFEELMHCQQVLDAINTLKTLGDRGRQGVSLQDVTIRMAGKSVHVKQVIERLCSEGHLFSTIDDQHFFTNIRRTMVFERSITSAKNDENIGIVTYGVEATKSDAGTAKGFGFVLYTRDEAADAKDERVQTGGLIDKPALPLTETTNELNVERVSNYLKQLRIQVQAMPRAPPPSRPRPGRSGRRPRMRPSRQRAPSPPPISVSTPPQSPTAKSSSESKPASTKDRKQKKTPPEEGDILQFYTPSNVFDLDQNVRVYEVRYPAADIRVIVKS